MDIRAGVVIDGERVGARVAALSHLDPLPDEPTLAQAGVVRPQLAAVLALPVGPELAVGIEAVMGRELSEGEQVEVVAATQRLISYATAAQHATLADLVDARDERVAREILNGQVERWAMRSGPSSIGAHLAPIAKIADKSATAVVARACYTHRHLPVAADTLAAGVSAPGQLQVVAEVARGAPPQLVGRLEAKAITLAGRTVAQLRAQLEAFLAQLDPEHHADAVRRGIADRDVWLGRSTTAGCARLVADLPVEQARAVWMWVDALARAAKAAGDTRRIGQLRADLLVAATTGVLRDMLTAALAAARSDDDRGAGAGAGLRLPVPTLDDLARLFELNIIITDESEDPEDPDDGDPEDPDDPQDQEDPDVPDVPYGHVEPVEPVEPSQQRVDHLAAIHALLAALASWTGPEPVHLPHSVQVGRVPIIIGRTTLTGDDDRPAHLPGHGPLSAERVRRLARSTAYRWLHVDPATGHLLHRHPRAHPPPPPERAWTSPRAPAPPPLPDQVSAAIHSPGYVPGSALRAHVQTRDATCIGLTHHHPAHGVDLDHVINYGDVRDGVPGVTAASNLAAQCRSTHLLKTHGGWQLEQPTPGHFIWTSPLGHRYERTATPLIPGWSEPLGNSRDH